MDRENTADAASATLTPAMSEPPSRPERSLLLIALSYPMFLFGLFWFMSGEMVVGATLTACGTFLIGVNERCLHIARHRLPAPH